MRIVLTKHAQDNMIDRGVSREMIEKAIKHGSKTKQTDGLLASFGYIKVAYHVQDNSYIVKTVMVGGGK